MRVSLATRIFLGYAAVLVTFGAVSLFGVSAMHENQTELRLISQGYLPLSQDAATLEALHSHQRRDLERLVDEKSPETRHALIRLSRLYTPAALLQHLWLAQDSVVKLARETGTGTRDTALLKELSTRLSNLSERAKNASLLLERVYQLLDLASPPAEALTSALTQLRGLDESTSRDFRALRATLDSHIRALAQEAEWRERRTGIAIITLSVIAIGVGLLATLFSARTLAPVRTLTQAAARIAQGDFSAQLGLKGEDEISQLARSFDAMTRSLQERQAQLQEKQEALLKAQQLAAAGRVSAQIAHEVRNPLSSIGLNVELLQENMARAQFADPAEAQEAHALLESVLKEVDRVTEVTEGYLDMARVPKPSLTAEDLNAVLDSVLDFSREELMRARVEVVRALDPEAPKALADEGQLRQVFLNLVRNSREAMHGGGQLTIHSRSVGEEVEVVFEDTGGGISAEAHAHIFEPFFSTKKNGTGLGLSVSEQIVQAHGGTIRCDSKPGEGTTFTLRFPRARTAPALSDASALAG